MEGKNNEDWKFWSEFSLLEEVDHLSNNTHYIGYLKKDNKKVFVKKFSKSKRFETELNIMKLYCPNDIVDYFKTIRESVLVLNFEDYRHVKLNQEIDIKKAAFLLADFHNTFKNDNSLGLDEELIPISERLKERMNQLQSHPMLNELTSIYKELTKVIKQIDQEFLSSNSIQLIHGDFGERNIVIDSSNTWRLIDFERARFDNIWMELLKLFEFELVSQERKELFLKEYLQVRNINKISNELYTALLFLETLGIYKYCEDVKDYDFSKKADYLIEKINKDLGI